MAEALLAVVAIMRAVLEPDYVVVGGGNAKKLGPTPRGVRMGENANAFVGGLRLWQRARRTNTRRAKSKVRSGGIEK